MTTLELNSELYRVMDEIANDVIPSILRTN